MNERPIPIRERLERAAGEGPEKGVAPGGAAMAEHDRNVRCYLPRNRAAELLTVMLQIDGYRATRR